MTSRAFLLPLIAFFFLAALLRLVGSALLLTRPFERSGVTFSDLAGGMTLAAAIAVAAVWAFLKVLKWGPGSARVPKSE